VREITFLRTIVVTGAVILGCSGRPSEHQSAQRALSTDAPNLNGPDLEIRSDRLVAAVSSSSKPAVAYGAGVFLATANGRHFRVRASDHQQLDPEPLPFAPQSDPCGASADGAVAFGENTFLAVWPSLALICAARIQPDGTVIDAKPVVVGHDADWDEGVSVASDGKDFLVVWRRPLQIGSLLQWDIRAVRVRAQDGTTLDGDGLTLSVGMHRPERPRVAFNGTNYVVVWYDPTSDNVLLATVNPTTAATSAPSSVEQFPFPPIQTPRGRPGLACDGTNCLVSWQWSTSILVKRVLGPTAQAEAAAARVLGTGVANYFPFLMAPAPAWDGQNYFVIWKNGLAIPAGLGGRHVTPEGSVSGERAGLVQGDASLPDLSGLAIASAQGKHEVLFVTSKPRVASRESQQLRWAVFDSGTGQQVLEPFVASQAPPSQHHPELAFDGRQHLAVWDEWNGESYVIRGARVRDSDGALLDPAGVDLSEALPVDQSYPKVASNGQNHLVVWQSGRSLHAVRVRGDDGAILDRPALSWPAQDNDSAFRNRAFLRLHAVGSNGSDYLVVWATLKYNPGQLLAMRISGADGKLIDSSPQVIHTGDTPDLPALAYAGGQYLLAWSEYGDKEGQVKAKRLSSVGAPIEPVLGLSGIMQGRDGTHATSHLAVAGDVALATWSTYEYDRQGAYFVQARRIRLNDWTVAGEVVQMNQLSEELRSNWDDGLVFDGTHFVVWASTMERRLGARYRVGLNRIQPDGTVVDRQPVIVAADPEREHLAGGASAGSGGRVLVAYTRLDPQADYTRARLRMRMLGAVMAPGLDAGGAPDVTAPPAVDAGSPPDVTAPPVVDAGSLPDVTTAPMVDAGSAPDIALPAAGDSGGWGDGTEAPAIDALASAADAPRDSRGDVLDGTLGGDVAREGSNDGLDDDDDAMACTCRIGGVHRVRPPALALLLGLVALVRVRRRRQPSSGKT
jgi:MYXO-CTERM domain-containing protein